MAPATKASQKRLEAAVTAFNARYSDAGQWGKERWDKSLYPALANPTTYCAVINQYAVSEDEGKKILAGSEDMALERVRFPMLLENQADGETHQDVGRVICYERYADSDGISHDSSSTQRPDSAMPFPVPHPASLGNQLLTHWNMDAASVLAAYMLDVQPGDHVLDMCAAPGGKSVVLAQALFPQLHRGAQSGLLLAKAPEMGSLLVNELDIVRYKRLTSNLKSYLPSSLFPTAEQPQAPVKVLNEDLSMKTSVSLLPRGAAAYDKVLVDAPCSSERHIIHAWEKARAAGQVAEEILNWKSSHVATLVKVQTGLLTTALKALRVGGRLVYATCALGREENDGVVEKVLANLAAGRKRAKKNGEKVDNWDVQFLLGDEGSQADVCDSTLQRMSESTKYGRIALPDHGGWGPLYFSVVTKVERVKRAKVGLKSKHVDAEPPIAVSADSSATKHETREP